MDHVFELLLEFFAIHAHSIAFPEITFPAVVRVSSMRLSLTIVISCLVKTKQTIYGR